MTKLAPEWVRTSDPVIRSPARYCWTTAPANHTSIYHQYNYALQYRIVLQLSQWKPDHMEYAKGREPLAWYHNCWVHAMCNCTYLVISNVYHGLQIRSYVLYMTSYVTNVTNINEFVNLADLLMFCFPIYFSGCRTLNAHHHHRFLTDFAK